ncbi:hypothetical protein P43SY_005813 [Pythium insidiosum]|uniref:LysM domain-containing protein n=1 Tax=Pythium insidiosum TaxID=114742 RepID=A0AAD5MJC3_PYTIN|nr:hypothetical protein P43SY_005813 [Pythium insidiosum]
MYGTYATSSASAHDAPPARALSEPSPFRYIVQDGDTLESIADKLNTTEKRLLKLNPMLVHSSSSSSKKHRVKLYAGQQLVVEEARQVSLPPPPECVDNGWGEMHVVRSGETLKAIAALYNTTEQYIRQDNRQYFPAGERGILFPGQMLHIRRVNIGQLETEGEDVTGSGPSVASTKYTTHRVTKRDTFESICMQYGLTYQRLLQINRGRFPIGARAELVVGEQLIVPDLDAAKRDAERRNIAEVKLTKQIHIVEAGETPHEIAERYRMTYEELREWNRAYFPKGYRGEIHPGHKLVVKRLDVDDYERIDDGFGGRETRSEWTRTTAMTA